MKWDTDSDTDESDEEEDLKQSEGLGGEQTLADGQLSPSHGGQPHACAQGATRRARVKRDRGLPHGTARGARTARP